MSFVPTSLVTSGRVSAKAHVNIALIKYWGKAPKRNPLEANLPAVPSLSLTLDALWTETQIRFDPQAPSDHGTLNGETMSEESILRCRPVLDRVRQLADVRSPFAITSQNHVPTAAGLASSASGMAALAAAASRCAGLHDETGESLSELARIGSGSASRSIFGGWATWEGASAAALAPPDHWDLSVVIAVVDSGPKSIGSREAMTSTALTSPYFDGWVTSAHATYERAIRAVKEKNLVQLIEAMEVSTMRMHACAMGAAPPILYWQPTSLAVIRKVEALRQSGPMCGWTMDAGPNVKIVCHSEDAEQVATSLSTIAGVQQVLTARPGPGISIEVGQG